tara:strand:- start:5934 stop:6578 length:645 start_codon:yes stop_codon:yes gene_type:complete
MTLVCDNRENIKLIGKGAYGTIFLRNNVVIKIATDAKEERTKHLDLWYSLPTSCRKYFVRPLKLPPDCKVTSKKYSLHAMEFFKGTNMHDYVILNVGLGNISLVEKALTELKKAILCMWKSGYIHNDLHMQNVLVSSAQKIKIIDFGLSEKVSPLKNQTSEKEISKWFSKKYVKVLKKHGFRTMNPDLYAYGVKKHRMFSKHNQKLYNVMHKIT